MKLGISFADSDGYLLVRIEGDWLPFTVEEALRAIAKAAKHLGHTRILLDGRKLAAPEFDLYRVFAGTDVARILPPPVKTAAVALAENINRIGERVALKHNAKVRVLSDPDRALAWLMDDSTG